MSTLRQGSIAIILAMVGVGLWLLWSTVSEADTQPSTLAGTSSATSPRQRAELSHQESTTARSTLATTRVILEVTNARSTPLGGVVVRLLGASPAPSPLLTDAAGIVELLMARPMPVQVAATGLTTQTFSPPPFGDAPEVFWSIAMKEVEAATPLHGFVHAANKPVVDAVVVVFGQEPDDSQLVKVGADGRFVFEERPLNATTIAAAAQSHGEVIAALASQTREYSLELPSPAFVEGTISDGQGRPVERATVRLAPRRPRARDKRLNRLMLSLMRNKERRADGRMLRRRFGEVDSRVEVADGVFRAGPIAARVVDVLGYAPGLSPDRVEGIELLPGQVFAGVDLTLAGAATLRGVVTDSQSGKPIPRAQLATSGPLKAPGFAQASSNNNGAFSLRLAPDTRQRLRVTARGYKPFEVGGIVVGTNETMEKNIVLTRGGKRGPHREREYVGIGATVKKVEGGVRIEKTLAGSAAREQLLKGDVIMRVDSTWVDDMDIQQAIELLVGETDTDVEILVRRTQGGEDQELNLTLTRQRLQYQSK